MSICVQAAPEQLEWKHFISVPTLVEPTRRKPVQLYTGFEYHLPTCKPQRTEQGFCFCDDMKVTIVPKARIKMGTARANALLQNEQNRYDIARLAGLALQRQLERVCVDDPRGLRVVLAQATHLHLGKRAAAIQQRYDQDTRLGKSPVPLRAWTNLLAQSLADEEVEHLCGMEL